MLVLDLVAAARYSWVTCSLPFVRQVVVSVARSSREGMKLVTDVSLLPALVQEAFGHDILVQLNALELLTTLSQSGQWRRSSHRRAKRPVTHHRTTALWYRGP